MKDKNGKEILAGYKCIVDDAILGVVTAVREAVAVVLMLKENPSQCYEEEVEPDRIAMK